MRATATPAHGLLSYLEGGWEDGRVADDDKTPKRNRWTPEGGSGGSGVPRPRFSPWLALPLLLIIVLIFNSWLGNANTKSIDYSTFVQHVENGDLLGTISIGSSDISGEYRDAEGNAQQF